MKTLKLILMAAFRLPLGILLGMSTSATQAQGSKVYIETGSGGAITITAISKAFRAEITGTHSLSKGDRVTFASVGGMTELNGQTGVVVDVTGTTKFVVNIDSRTYTTFTSGGTATPVTFTAIGDITGFKPDGASVDDNEVTDLDSEAKEFLPGLVDNGAFSVDIQYVGSNPGQAAVRTAFEGSLLKGWKITTPDSKTYTFDGYVKKFPTLPDASTGKILTGSISVRISGAVTAA